MGQEKRDPIHSPGFDFSTFNRNFEKIQKDIRGIEKSTHKLELDFVRMDTKLENIMFTINTFDNRLKSVEHLANSNKNMLTKIVAISGAASVIFSFIFQYTLNFLF